ncbi:uncharacterized protein MELLADRAFT_114191, partial [Melampsora larici-populina 98AG31]
ALDNVPAANVPSTVSPEAHPAREDPTEDTPTVDVSQTSGTKSSPPSPRKNPAPLLINPPGGIPAGGVPVPVNLDVRTVAPKQKPSIWAVSDSTIFEVTPKTVKSKTLNNTDVPDVYRAALSLLWLRSQGTDHAALDVSPLPTPHFKILPKSKLRVHTWLNKPPNMRLFQCDSEAPWYRPDVFNLHDAEVTKRPSPNEKAHTQFVREILAVFSHSSTTKIDQGVKYVLAAIACCNMENVEISPPAPSTLATCANVKIENGLRAAHHYHQLQLCTSNSVIYGMLEAIATLRALFRHTEFIFQQPEQQHDKLEQDYASLTKSVGVGQVPPVQFGLLVAFLTSGVKGLLIFPRDPTRFGLCKLAPFLVLVSQLQAERPIEEPFWKHTQHFLLEIIREALFPQGFYTANATLDDPSSQDEWHPKECSKLDLARAIQRDLAAFCELRPQLTGAPYPDNPYDLPFHPVTTRNQASITPQGAE